MTDISHLNRSFFPYLNEPQEIREIDPHYRILTESQLNCFYLLQKARLRKIDAPGGWGKSTVMLSLALWDVLEGEHKSLILAPQNHISKGFLRTNSFSFNPQIKIDNREYDFKINDFTKDGNINELREWLLTSFKVLSKRDDTIAVSTHQAFVCCLKGMLEEEEEISLNNLSLFVDESMGLRLLGYTGEMEDEFKNELTKKCDKVIANPRNKLTVATATHYRGDGIAPYVPQIDFTVFKREWDKHYPTLGIDRFDIQYQEYLDKDPIDDCVINILKEPNHKHFVIVPSRGNKWRHPIPKDLKTNIYQFANGRDEQLNRLIFALEKAGLRVLDLVSQTEQEGNKQKLLAEPKALTEENQSKYDVVITCKLGRIGTDWVPCDRIHNMSLEQSIMLAVQTLLRPMRKCTGKTDIKAYHYIEPLLDLKKGSSKKDLIGDRTICLLIGFLIDEELNPIMIPILKKNRKKGEKNKKSFNEILTENGIDQNEFLEEIALEIDIENKSKEQILNVCSKFVEELEIDDELKKDITNSLFQKFMRAACAELRLRPSIPIEHFRGSPLDIIKEEPDQGVSLFLGKIYQKDWAEFRKFLNGTKITIEDCQKISREKGGECLSVSISNGNQKLKWKCNFEHKWLAIYWNIKKGSWCPYCAGKDKKTLKHCHDLANKRKGKFLSKEYVTARTSYKWQCENGHTWFATYNAIQQGRWCKKCAGTEKFNIDFAKKIGFEKKLKCLNDVYNNIDEPLLWQCIKCEYVFSSCLYNIRKGKGCSKCRIKSPFYTTMIEAQLAVNKLNPRPKTMREYRKYCNQDELLPTHPDNTYKNEWMGDNYFLSTKPKRADYEICIKIIEKFYAYKQTYSSLALQYNLSVGSVSRIIKNGIVYYQDKLND